MSSDIRVDFVCTYPVFGRYVFLITNLNETNFSVRELKADFVIGLTDLPIDANHPPSDYWLCASHSGQLPIGTTTFTCQPTVVSGRFLFIRSPKNINAALTLSEVQVYSERSVPVTSSGQVPTQERTSLPSACE
ncbi:hypothetical protein NP493_2107g00003 [Ridgeia piscesae]|uniref:Uncharacterized protein n=1 Tax=Ridgeia piscesae TaxID=27915 RepID=A0AAD9JN79_RIDPI|nr:hypothetical protein NP493_2107g00003 [Ridgeia piscesae]